MGMANETEFVAAGLVNHKIEAAQGDIEYDDSRKTAYFSDSKKYIESQEKVRNILLQKRIQMGLTAGVIILLCIAFFYWRA